MRLVCLASVLVFSGCATVHGSRPVAAEVMVVGTEHRGHLLQPGYPLSWLETLLRSWKPDLLLVEIRPEALAAGHLEDGPLEMSYVTLVARELGIPVVGIDWYREADFNAPPAPEDPADRAEYDARYGAEAEQLDSYDTFAALNDPARARAVLAMRNAGLQYGLADASAWERRQAWFHQRASEAIAARHPHRTLAFVGFAHRPQLEAWLESQGSAAVAPTSITLPAEGSPVPDAVLAFWKEAVPRLRAEAARQPSPLRERLEAKARAWEAALERRGLCCEAP